MKKIKTLGIAALILMSSAFLRAQHKPVYEREGDKIRVTHYFDDGNIRETGTYFEGKPHGKWVQYNENGIVVYEANYNGGEKEGKWFRWADDGSVLFEMVFEDNLLVDVQKWKIEERNMLAGN